METKIIEKQDRLKSIKNCESKKYESFVKGDIILNLSAHTGLIGLLLEGSASIITIDENGRDNISDFLTVGDSFGEHIIMPLESMEYIVIAETDCRVLFVNYENVMNNCHHKCENHNELIKKMLLFTSQRAQYLSLHVSILSKKSLREKILTYLEYLKQKSPNSDVLVIPITYERLASYLGADRSALMREIRRMNNDGIISSDGKEIRILK